MTIEALVGGSYKSIKALRKIKKRAEEEGERKEEKGGKRGLLLLDKESKRVWSKMQCGFFYRNGSDRKEGEE